MRHHLQYTHVSNTAHLRYPSPWHGPWRSAPPRGPRLHPTTTSPPRTVVGIPTFQRAFLSCLGILEEMNQIESRISKISSLVLFKHVIWPSSRHHHDVIMMANRRFAIAAIVFERDVRKLLVVYVAFLRHGKTFHAMPSTY